VGGAMHGRGGSSPAAWYTSRTSHGGSAHGRGSCRSRRSGRADDAGHREGRQRGARTRRARRRARSHGRPDGWRGARARVGGERRRGRRGELERPGTSRGDAASPPRRAATLDGPDHRVRGGGRGLGARSNDRARPGVHVPGSGSRPGADGGGARDAGDRCAARGARAAGSGDRRESIAGGGSARRASGATYRPQAEAGRSRRS
jgi:hypothetical protein